MKITFKSLLYCLLLISIQVSAQWNDSFDDGDFSINPIWKGDTSKFEIDVSRQLHLKAPAISGKAYLAAASSVSAAASWEFRIRMDFNPSSGNYAKVYLMSDNPKLDSSLNGYFIRIGYTNDDVSLFRQDGYMVDLVIDGRNGMLASSMNKIAVYVTRSIEGEWKLFCDTTNQANFKELGTGIDSTYMLSNFFGVQCIYTSTRSSKFFFDDFMVLGKASNDTISPQITGFKAVDDSLVSIMFSELMNSSTILNTENYKISDDFSIKQVILDDTKQAVLKLSSTIQCNHALSINISGITDLAGNSLADSTLEISYCSGNAYDVLISEIMADPDPPVYLPNLEYLELFNKSGLTLNLENWTLQIGDSRIILPEINLPADSFLLICPLNGCYQYHKNICFEGLSKSILNNGGEYIGIANQKGKLIHWVTYDESYYHDNLKMAGGWSLEMIDFTQPCLGSENWKASSDFRGGSPGKINSVSGSVNDNQVFQYNHIFLKNDSTIRLYFSKPLDIESLSFTMFSVDHTIGNPVKIVFDSLQHLFADLIFSVKFNPDVSYVLQLSEDIKSCSGDKIGKGLIIPFQKPSQLAPNDIIINELLFNALPGNQEFIELYNNSNKFIASNELKIAYRNVSGNYGQAIEIGEYPFLIPPKSYIVLVKTLEGLNDHYRIYDMTAFFKTKDLPALSNEEGCVAIMNKGLQILDEFCYSDKMQFPLLVNLSGVSLERIRNNSQTNDPENWHSASSDAGFSTPGSINSQFLEAKEMGTEITLEYEMFSPDNDGYKDVETLFYNLEQTGFVANIIVFDALGRQIKILANNKHLGTQGSFTWDGIDEKGRLAPTGIYLIYIELHHHSGEIKQYKRTCVLGRLE